MSVAAGAARTALVLALAGVTLGAVPPTTTVQLLSGPSPLAGACPVNDRTILYGPFGAGEEREDESDVAVDPRDPRRLAVAWMQDSGTGIVVASSDDGGRTWMRTVVPGLSVCTGGSADRVIHPRLVFDDGGTLYLATSPLDGFWPDPRSASSHIAVSSSSDSGRTWTTPVSLDVDAGAAPVLNDFHPPTTEPGRPGVISIMWAREESAAHQLVLSRSTDAGKTWIHRAVEGPVPGGLTSAKLLAHPDGTLVAVVNDGSVPGFFAAPTPAASAVRTPLRVIRSTDGGATWTQTAELDASSDAFWPATAVTAAGALHVVWNGQDDLRADVFHHATSADAGRTWVRGPDLARGPAAPGVWRPTLAASGEHLALLDFGLSQDARSSVVRLATRPAGGPWSWQTVAVTDRLGDGALAGIAGVPGGFVASFALGSPQAEHGPLDLFLARVRPSS